MKTNEASIECPFCHHDPEAQDERLGLHVVRTVLVGMSPHNGGYPECEFCHRRVRTEDMDRHQRDDCERA